ncbi:MAG: hypothetical protein ACHP84_12285, partial [Caulobacterales bacterium]
GGWRSWRRGRRLGRWRWGGGVGRRGRRLRDGLRGCACKRDETDERRAHGVFFPSGGTPGGASQ